MNWLSLLSMFSGPVMSLVDKAVFAGVTSAVSYGVGKGIIQPTDSAAVAGGLIALASGIFSFVKNTASAKIVQVNQDPSNGARVIPAHAAPATPTLNPTAPRYPVDQNVG